jgi:NADH:ubiquinone oxidoreductase subunit F (NADH-binding)
MKVNLCILYVETKTIYMKNKFVSAIGTIVFIATFFQSGAQNYDTVQIITHKITEKIFTLEGAVATKKDLIAYRTMLQTLRDRIAGAMSKGKTLDEIIASDPTKEYTAVFDRSAFIMLVYDSLKK